MRDPRHYNLFSKFAQKKIAANKDNTSYTIGPSGEVYDGTPDIIWNELVFIKDAKVMWTHGQLYSFVGATYIWLSKTIVPFYITQSEWAEEGVDQSPEQGGAMTETIYGQAFYGDSPEYITKVEMRPTSGVRLESINYEDGHKTAIITIKVDGVSLDENTDVVFTFYSAHCEEGRNALLTIVPTANGKDGERGDVGVGIGSVITEYFANGGADPNLDAEIQGADTPSAAGFGAEHPVLWQRMKIYSTEALLINTPRWNLVGRYAADGKDAEVQYSVDGNDPWFYDWREGCVYMRFKTNSGWGEAIKIVGEDGSDGAYTDYSFGLSQYAVTREPSNALVGPSDIREEDWTDGPQAVTEAKPYLWMRSLRYEEVDGVIAPQKQANGENKYYYTRLTGEAGVSPLVVDLSNEMTSVPVNLENKVVGEKRIQLEAHAFIGTKEQNIDSVTISAVNGSTYSPLDPKGFTLTSASSVNRPILIVADTTTMADTTDVELSVRIGSETRKAIFSIAAVKSHNGKDAELFELAPRKSSLSFVRNEDNSLSPEYLTEEVRIKWVKGEESGIASVGDERYPSVKSLVVKYGYNEDEANHSLVYNTTDKIKVYATDAQADKTLYLSLWSAEGRLIDRESIPLLKDGTNGTNGVTPHVGDDGYWYFGDEKTDTKAEPDKPGVWTIGENGNWFYNDADSGKKAIATDGQGVSVSYAFRRSATTLGSSDKPTGGSYVNQQPDATSIAKGWSDTVPNGTNPVYMSQRTFTSDGKAPQSSEWTIPCLMVDTADIDICYSAQEEKPSAPTTHGTQNGPTWYQDIADAVWMAVSSKTGGEWSDWSITKIKGEKGEDGKDGESPLVVDLENEMTSIPVGEDGAVVRDIQLGLKLNAFIGTQSATITSAVCSGYSSGNIIYSATTPSQPTITFKAGAKPGEITEFPIVVSVEGMTATRTVTYTVAAVKSGGKGEDAILYELFPYPSALVFARNDDGSLSAVQNYIDVLLKRTEGSNITTPGVGTFKVRYKLNGFPTSATSDNALPANSRISLTTTQAESTSTIGLALYTEGGTLIDKETIPVLKDGKKGEDGEDGKDGKDAITLDIDNEMDSVPCTIDGHPTKAYTISTNVRLYVGATAQNLTSGVKASVLCEQTANVSYSGGVATVSWSIPVSVTLDGRYTSTITCKYNGVDYAATFTLVAVRAGADGTSPTIYQVLPSVAAIAFACEDGENYTPASISVTCGYTKQIGDGAIESVESASAIADSPYNIYYRIIGDGGQETWKQYTAPPNVANTTTATRYDFCIAKGSPTTATNIIDIEGVPVVRDGKKGAKGDPGKDGAGAVRENLFDFDTPVRDSAANTVAFHTDSGLYIYNGATSSDSVFTIIDGISDGDFYVQFVGNAKIGYCSGTTFHESTSATAGGITSAKVAISGDERIAIKTSAQQVTLSNIKIEEGIGLTAPTVYCPKRTKMATVIRDSLLSDTWTTSGRVAVSVGYQNKYDTYALANSTIYIKQTVKGLTIGKRYCLSFYMTGSNGASAVISAARLAYACTLSSNKYGILASGNKVSYAAGSNTEYQLCKIVFVAGVATTDITLYGACFMSLIKLEEGEKRSLSRDEVNTRDLSALSNSEIQQMQVSFEASSMSASAGVANATKYQASTTDMTIESPGVVVLGNADANVSINLASFKNGDVLRLICNSKAINSANARAVFPGNTTLYDILKTPVSLVDSLTDDQLKSNYALINHLHKVVTKATATSSTNTKIEGCGALIQTTDQDQVARVALVGATAIYFAGGMLEFVYVNGAMWLRNYNSIDYFADYGESSSAITFIGIVNGQNGSQIVTPKHTIERRYFDNRIQYIFVKQ